LKIKVLMFCGQFRPLIGGAERQTEELANALALAGCQVTIVTLRRDTASPDIEESNGVRIERLPFIDLSQRFSFRGIAFINIPFILLSIAKVMFARFNGIDIVHCQMVGLETLGVIMAARIKGLPVLVTAHTADRHSELGKIKKTGFTGNIIAMLARAMIKNWVAISTAVEYELVNAGVPVAQISRIPNGVKLPATNHKKVDKQEACRFLCLGRLSTTAERDVSTLLKAFDRLALEYVDVELALVGGGNLLDQTKREAEQMKASDKIILPGFDDAEKWLDWADCFVLPSRYEGLSMALLESMASGLPCIANDILPNREVLDNGSAGVLVPVGDENKLFEAMHRMVSDVVHAEAMRSASLNRVHTHYGIESVAKRYIELYQKLALRRS